MVKPYKGNISQTQRNLQRDEPPKLSLISLLDVEGTEPILTMEVVQIGVLLKSWYR